MAKKWENDKNLLVIKMSWREYVAITDSFGLCDCCGTQDFSDGGYYVALVDDWYCSHCYNLYMSGAQRFSVDLEKERQNYNRVVNALKGLGTWDVE